METLSIPDHRAVSAAYGDHQQRRRAATKPQPRFGTRAEIIAAPVKRGTYGETSVASVVVGSSNATAEHSLVFAELGDGSGALKVVPGETALVSAMLVATGDNGAV
jgi:hypothetical protein